MGITERRITHAMATQLTLEIRRIMSEMGLPCPTVNQLQFIRAELVKPSKNLLTVLPANQQGIIELKITGGVEGFSLSLLDANGQRLPDLSDRLEHLVDELVITAPFDVQDWGAYLEGVLETWWHIHSNIWTAHGSGTTAHERSIQAMARDLDSKLPTASLANSEARNVVFGLYTEVARKRSRMSALQIAQLTSKVMGHLYELRTPQSVNVKETIDKFVD